MKLIIDIPEKVYKRIQALARSDYFEHDICGNSMLRIANGTPLPKEHGRLIDADEFQRYCFNKNFDRRLSEGGLATINMFLELQPTIIEADRGE